MRDISMKGLVWNRRVCQILEPCVFDGKLSKMRVSVRAKYSLSRKSISPRVFQYTKVDIEQLTAEITKVHRTSIEVGWNRPDSGYGPRASLTGGFRARTCWPIEQGRVVGDGARSRSGRRLAARVYGLLE